MVSRNIPVAVKKELRKEVEFGCPINGCGVPYLEYHHFDPPWHVENHHRPEGMIALCATHHAKADAFTVKQMREFKNNAQNEIVKGRFEWLRDEVLARIGGNYFFKNQVELRICDVDVVWFERDDAGNLCLNINFIEVRGQKLWVHPIMRNNDWIFNTNVLDIDCKASGKELEVKFYDGSMVSIAFKEIKTPGEAIDFDENMYGLLDNLKEVMDGVGDETLPLLVADIKFKFPKLDLDFTKNITSSNSGFMMQGCLMIGNYYGVQIG
ncbi:MAG: hypothetical protein Q4A03_02360 [Rothia sp. (in: high G+C Gram-positive bacteria)]|uniref:hypothetical protein n=1 Tax=Rothia sp. (in: high G+C Gram-positive bacteria) TaxID=1885016 RepID=UPI00270DB7F9|nr:hypothetical protein [Rothia sp. (in: high G+C Gram-positive bacteria)]